MRPFNFPIQPGARFDINVSDSQVFHMPVELSLKFMAIIGSYGLNREGGILREHFSGIIQNNPWIFPYSVIAIQGLLSGRFFLLVELFKKYFFKPDKPFWLIELLNPVFTFFPVCYRGKTWCQPCPPVCFLWQGGVTSQIRCSEYRGKITKKVNTI